MLQANKNLLKKLQQLNFFYSQKFLYFGIFHSLRMDQPGAAKEENHICS